MLKAITESRTFFETTSQRDFFRTTDNGQQSTVYFLFNVFI